MQVVYEIWLQVVIFYIENHSSFSFSFSLKKINILVLVTKISLITSVISLWHKLVWHFCKYHRVFTARCMCVVQYMQLYTVCPTCPSVALMNCVETTELIVKQLALDYSLRTLVWRHQMWNIYLKGLPHWGH